MRPYIVLTNCVRLRREKESHNLFTPIRSTGPLGYQIRGSNQTTDRSCQNTGHQHATGPLSHRCVPFSATVVKRCPARLAVAIHRSARHNPTDRT